MTQVEGVLLLVGWVTFGLQIFMDPPDLDFQRSDYQIESSRPSPKLRAVSPKAKVSVFIDFSRHYNF